jgi:hypothetical protein
LAHTESAWVWALGSVLASVSASGWVSALVLALASALAAVSARVSAVSLGAVWRWLLVAASASVPPLG